MSPSSHTYDLEIGPGVSGYLPPFARDSWNLSDLRTLSSCSRPNPRTILTRVGSTIVSPLAWGLLVIQSPILVPPLVLAAAGPLPQADLLRPARAPPSKLPALAALQHPSTGPGSSQCLPGTLQGPALNTAADSLDGIWLACAPIWQLLCCQFYKPLLMSLLSRLTTHAGHCPRTPHLCSRCFLQTPSILYRRGKSYKGFFSPGSPWECLQFNNCL